MLASIQPLDRVALSFGPFTIYWYGLIIGIGLLLGLYLAIREGNRRGLPKDTFVDLILFAAPIAIICARIYYVLFNFNHYKDNPADMFKIWEGGIAIHGALIGAFVTGIVYAKVRNLSFWKLADIAAPSLLLGQAIGRWGNFMNQEAHGDEVTRSFLENTLHLPDFIVNQMYINGTYYHPTFLYESIWNLIGVIILLSLRRVNVRRGEIFLTYLAWYSFGRFFIEGLRTDSLMIAGTDLRMAQVMSIILFVGAIGAIIFRRTKGYATERYLEM
ncbi:MAG: prolipoprotein diacylglyceryl transferase [Bacillaceae bacterium]